MIVLITGLPGAGKSLYTLQVVEALRKSSNRVVRYSGFEDLKFEEWKPIIADQWDGAEDGAIIVIDEAQRIFRVRPTGATVPPHVALLETHRHRGLDIYLVTQHPKLLDTNVRRLVGKHFHVVRTFGMQRATVHEWGEVNETPERRTESIRHEWRYPKELFSAYKSAEVHTVKRSIPARVWLLGALPIVIAGLGYGVYGWLQGRIDAGATVVKEKASKPIEHASGSQGRSGSASPGAVQARSLAVADSDALASFAPRVPGLPHTAPRYDDVTKAVHAPYPAMCVSSASRCQCYSQAGTRIPTIDRLCREFAINGFFADWVPLPSRLPDRAVEPPQAAGARPSVEPVPLPSRVLVLPGEGFSGSASFMKDAPSRISPDLGRGLGPAGPPAGRAGGP